MKKSDPRPELLILKRLVSISYVDTYKFEDQCWFLYLSKSRNSQQKVMNSEAEFKEIEPWLKYETRFKHGWFHLKLY